MFLILFLLLWACFWHALFDGFSSCAYFTDFGGSGSFQGCCCAGSVYFCSSCTFAGPGTFFAATAFSAKCCAAYAGFARSDSFTATLLSSVCHTSSGYYACSNAAGCYVCSENTSFSRPKASMPIEHSLRPFLPGTRHILPSLFRALFLTWHVVWFVPRRVEQCIPIWGLLCVLLLF